MADLLFGGFALMPGPVRKAKIIYISKKQSNFNIAPLRGRNRRSLATIFNCKGNISGGIKGFFGFKKTSIRLILRTD